MYLRLILSCPKISCIHAIATRWTRPRCLMLGFRPERMTAIIAWLSSWKTISLPPLQMASQSCNNGRANCFKTLYAATVSDSVEDVETQPCRFDQKAVGKQVFSPLMHTYAPLVERCVKVQPPKSASEKTWGFMVSNSSPTHPISRSDRVECT